MQIPSNGPEGTSELESRIDDHSVAGKGHGLIDDLSEVVLYLIGFHFADDRELREGMFFEGVAGAGVAEVGAHTGRQNGHPGQDHEQLVADGQSHGNVIPFRDLDPCSRLLSSINSS
jgi:hypothetical protein